MVISSALFNIDRKENVLISFDGSVTSRVISDLLQRSEIALENQRSVVRKRVYNVLVEGLQNLYHHAEERPETGKNGEPQVKLLLWFDTDSIFIQMQNVVKGATINKISTQIEYINSLDRDQLKAFYREVLNNTKFSEKGGASLGLIDMAKRSGEPLLYKFSPLDENYSMFNLVVQVKK